MRPDVRGMILICNAVAWTFFVTFVTRTSSGFDGAAVLRNFKLEACEGQSLDLKCPENTTISISSVSLQREETWKDEENIGCPPLGSSARQDRNELDAVDKQTRNEQQPGDGGDGPVVARVGGVASKDEDGGGGGDGDGAESDGSGVGRCRLSTMQSRMLRTMGRLCDGHRFCEAPVSAELLLGRYEGRPCRGQVKRMEVFYKCRPAVFETRVVCEDEPFELRCGGRSRVMVSSTTFGRNPVGAVQCPQKDGGAEESCDSDSPSFEIMAKLCDGRDKCGLIADPVVFADPCEERSSPFLTIVYACVPEHVLFNAEPIGEDGLREDEHGNVIDPSATTRTSSSPSSPPPDFTTGATPLTLPTLVLNMEESPPSNQTRRHFYFPSESLAANYTRKPGESSEEERLQKNDLRRHIAHWNETMFPELCDTNVTKANHVMGVITEWLHAYRFILDNLEKFILYLLLSVCLGLLLFCSVLICHLWALSRRRARRLRREKLRSSSKAARNGSSATSAGVSSATGPAGTSSTSPTASAGVTSPLMTASGPGSGMIGGKPRVKTVASVGTVTDFPPPPTSSTILLTDCSDEAADVRDSRVLLDMTTPPRFGGLGGGGGGGGTLPHSSSSTTPSSGGSNSLGRPYRPQYHYQQQQQPPPSSFPLTTSMDTSPSYYRHGNNNNNSRTTTPTFPAAATAAGSPSAGAVSPSSRPGLLAPLVEIDGNGEEDDFGDGGRHVRHYQSHIV